MPERSPDAAPPPPGAVTGSIARQHQHLLVAVAHHLAHVEAERIADHEPAGLERAGARGARSAR